MRILFSCRPHYGHVYPLMPLADAARDAGHDVSFATGARFVPRLREWGYSAVEAGIGVDEAEAEAKRRLGDVHPYQLMIVMFGDILPRATLAGVLPILREQRPDLVVYEQSDVGAGAAAMRARIPFAGHVIGRSMPRELLDQIRPQFEALWQGRVPSDPWLGDVGLDVWPPSFADPGTAAVRTRIPLRPVPWSPPGPLLQLPAGPRPLIYLTLGTVVYGAVDVLKAAIQGLARLPVDVLVALGPGDPASVGEVPANARVEGFVPQAEVLRHASLVVHHGGSGTTLGALANGLPQLVLPQGADQFVNAEALATQGAGRQLLAADADAITAEASRLLDDPIHRQAAERLAAEIAAMPAPADVLPQLVECASRGLS